ncbi:hypothetical protein [Agromyces aerolatus]|uniref:hypothetical protein n=1 Tax=Agromyces sp. LY-1074 TaxID=3074080 RepID=UPI002860831A|nr:MULTISPECIES: hypothetical protein [unclassified Agromyces]MDR5701845.1 hypothetical protein [Agromyces sp. LY-1074]MDR5708082.1 hypothetical protein [Agromyces sp. LY-1358]
MELLVDVANVLGSRPDGWWRDRAGATTRLLANAHDLIGTRAGLPDGAAPAEVTIDAITVVLEGAANRAEVPETLTVVRAPGSGDDAIVDTVRARVADHLAVLVVTADRGLRARLPESVPVAGPEWLNRLLER